MTDPDELKDIIAEMKKDPWSYTCIQCKRTYPDYEMVEVTEPHGEVTLACPGCGSGELE